ncbi:TPA: 50S ribosomal protein L21 [bacterium]|nr:50S ribosomal protein L21 [bacterium]
MYAIVESGGKQYKVEEGSTLRVEKIDFEIGQEIELDRVLMVVKDEEIIIGQPLEKSRVIAEVVDQDRHRKIRIFKFKRRKNYRRKIGHRQPYTALVVKRIEI